MPKVFKLGHVTLGVADLSQTRDYYVRALGLNEVEADSRTAWLSVATQHHDIALVKGNPGLLHLGYQLTPGTDLGRFQAEARAFGLQAELKSDSQPGIAAMVEVTAPGGHVLQFYDRIETPCPGYSGRGVAPLRLGHVAVITPEADRMVALYRDFLGFWETDWIGDLANFLTCNSEHHVVNVVKAPPSKVHHIAFQLHETADHARAADLLAKAKIPTKWGPSRHTAGHNLAAYHHDPDQVLIELYTDMDVWLPELGYCQERPWHEQLPMRPKRWGLHELSAWETGFTFDLARG